MMGLLLKDLYELRSYKKNLLFLVILFAVLVFSQSGEEDSSSVAVLMIMIIFSMIGLSTFSYDEKTNTNRYLMTLPLTKKDLIKEKYLLSILFIIMGSIIGILFNFGIFAMINNKFPDVEETFSFAFGGIVGLSLVHGIQIPLMYQFGAEKARIQIYIIFMVIGGILGAFSFVLPADSFDIFNRFHFLLPLVCFLLSFFIYFISYKVSCFIYQKKDV